MLWRDLLVFADGSANGLARAQMAAAIATGFPSCTLTLCVPAILPMRPYGIGASVVSGIYDSAVQLAREDAAVATKRVSGILQDANVSLRVVSPEWELSAVAAEAAALARTFDAIIVGQPIEADQSASDDLLLSGALFGSGRPVIVMPRWDEPHPIGARILVAWSDTREAARAIHDALPLLTAADSVHLVHKSEKGKEGPEVRVRFGDMAQHLRAHGVKELSSDFIDLDGAPSSTLIDAAMTHKSDLVVMGGYGHNRLREFMFGGMTRTMLHQADVVLLLSH